MLSINIYPIADVFWHKKNKKNNFKYSQVAFSLDLNAHVYT